MAWSSCVRPLVRPSCSRGRPQRRLRRGRRAAPHGVAQAELAARVLAHAPYAAVCLARARVEPTHRHRRPRGSDPTWVGATLSGCLPARAAPPRCGPSTRASIGLEGTRRERIEADLRPVRAGADLDRLHDGRARRRASELAELIVAPAPQRASDRMAQTRPGRRPGPSSRRTPRSARALELDRARVGARLASGVAPPAPHRPRRLNGAGCPCPPETSSQSAFAPTRTGDKAFGAPWASPRPSWPSVLSPQHQRE